MASTPTTPNSLRVQMGDYPEPPQNVEAPSPLMEEMQQITDLLEKGHAAKTLFCCGEKIKKHIQALDIRKINEFMDKYDNLQHVQAMPVSLRRWQQLLIQHYVTRRPVGQEIPAKVLPKKVCQCLDRITLAYMTLSARREGIAEGDLRGYYQRMLRAEEFGRMKTINDHFHPRKPAPQIILQEGSDEEKQEPSLLKQDRIKIAAADENKAEEERCGGDGDDADGK